MTSILLTGHGKVSSGMYETLRMLFGVNDNIKFVDFLESDTSESLKERLKKEIDNLLQNSEQVICLTDIKGGTPFKTCAEISLEQSNIAVIAGTNVPMLLTLASEMEDITLEEATTLALETGKADISKFEFKPIQNDIDDDEDGI